MHKVFFILLSCCSLVSGFAQDSALDSKYLEDQFYMGITYNFLLHKPENATQRNLSYGLNAGVIKDIPLNLNRNFGVGIGLGYAINSYYTNIYAESTDSDIVYSVLGSDVSFKRSKFETHLIEMPFEIRWRTSNAVDYKFWRIYAGAKLAYVVGGRSKFVSEAGKHSFTNTDINKWQYGLTLNFGYNTFNVHVYYALSTLLDKNAVVLDTGEDLKVAPLRVGFVFYIL